jgi:hypothetical protein
MSAGSVAPCPLTVRLVTSDSAVELLEHVGGTQLLATVPQPPVTRGDRQNGRTVGREGRRGVVSIGRLRAGRQGRDPGRENSLPP